MKSIITLILLILLPHSVLAHEERESPWHFHTGEGIALQEYQNAEGEPVTITATCKFSSMDPDCREKVYYFEKEEIEQILNDAEEVYTKDSYFEGFLAATYAYTSHYLGKGVVIAILSPEPTSTVIGITVLVVKGVFAVGSAGLAVWEGKKAYDSFTTIRILSEELMRESLYVNRCGHISRGFLNRIGKLGVNIVFNEHGYRTIPSHYYLEAVEAEEELVATTKEIAREKDISYKQAYGDSFTQSCGQLPMNYHRLPTEDNPYIDE